MAIDIKMDLHGSQGESIDVVRQLIEKRKQELGFTTAQTCTALAINILKSLRAGTSVANDKEKPHLTVVDVSDQYYPSWVTKGAGKNNRTRVLREGRDGAVVTPKYVTWRCNKYFPGQIVKTYEITDTIADDKAYKYLIVTDNPDTAIEIAENRHKKRIARAKGLAKFALGWAMHLVHDAQATPQDAIEENARNVGLANVHATVQDTGFNEGNVDIHVEDALNYATDALKNQDVNVAVQNALNKMIGFVNHQLHQKGIYDDLKIPEKTLEENA